MPTSHSLPESLLNDANRDVLAFLEGLSAHSDVAEELMQASKRLGEAQAYCPDPANYAYVVLSTQNVIFAVAWGMRTIGFRLDETYRQRALETGARAAHEIGERWVRFEVFRANYPKDDLPFWATKAYLIARGADPS